MSSRRLNSIPLGGRYRQVSLYIVIACRRPILQLCMYSSAAVLISDICFPGHHSTSTCHRILGQSLTTDIADTVKFIAPNSQHFHFPLNVLTFTIPILYRVQWTEPHLGYIQVNDHKSSAHLFTVYWGISTPINWIVFGSANGVSSVWCLVIVCISTALSLNHTFISIIDNNKSTMPNGHHTCLLSTEHRLIPNTVGDTRLQAPNYSV